MVNSAEISSAEKLFEEANELLSNDLFEKALDVFSKSFEACDKENNNKALLYNILIRKCEAFAKLGKHANVLDECQLAFDINSNDSRGYLKKG